MAPVSGFQGILAILAVFVAAGGLAIYRLFLSPLARFPGPKLAALTGWYEVYFDCFKRGRFWVEIEEMHKKYGPIVRISPWELHVDDPDWNESFKMSARVDKYHWFYKFAGSTGAAFGTANHDLHRARRKSQQGYFTQDAVAQFDPQLRDITLKLSARLEDVKGTGQPINLSNAFRSLATDVVTEFCFHKSYNFLDLPDFAASFHGAIRDFTEIGIWDRHFGLILNIFLAIPRWIVALINPAGVSALDFFNDITQRTTAIIDTYDKSGSKIDNPNIVHRMLESPDLPESDKAAWRLVMEARTFVAAGTETTGNTLSVTAYHLLANPEKAERLKSEIQAAQLKAKAPLTHQELQQLPYLTSVVLEGLRISSSVSGRLPRINTRETIRYKDYVIPVGTPVSMTQKLIHDNPNIFASPRTFLPERWLDPAERKQLEKYLQPFGRGSRSCLGIYLANAELYSTLAMLFGNFQVQLAGTQREDLEQFYDFFSPFLKAGKGLRVTIE